MKTSAKYNKPIEFWIAESLTDAYLDIKTFYKMVFADYASMVAKTEKRGTQEGQLVLVGYFDIALRFRSGVTIDKSMIVKHEDDFYTIQSIVNDRDKEYQLVCTANDKIQEIFEYSNPYENIPPVEDNDEFSYEFDYVFS